MRLHLIISIFLVFLFFTAAHSQDNLPEFGKVDIADLQMKECPFDKGADAMYLFNYENAKFIVNNGYYVEIERRIRIKIFRQTGLKYATVIIPFVSKNRLSRITGISGVTCSLDPNGNVITKKLERKDILKEKEDKDESSIRFAFPGVSPGDVIELKYVQKERNTLYLSPWLFQDVIPCRLSHCNLEYDNTVRIFMHLNTVNPLEQKIDTIGMDKDAPGVAAYFYSSVTRAYTMRDVPAFRVEPLMTSVKDNLQRIEFSVSPSRGFAAYISVAAKWGFFVKDLVSSDEFSGQFKKDISGTALKLDTIKKLPSAGEKIAAVCQWVEKTIKWNGDESVYADDIDDLNSVWASTRGSNTEINLIMLNLLKKAGLHCSPILISTNSHGKVDMEFPSISQFNGMDVYIKDGARYYIVDGTQVYQSYKIPPYNILNNYALVVDDDESRWIHVSDERQLMRNVINIKADIDSNGVMRGQVFEYFYDYARVDMLSNSSRQEDDIDKDFLERNVSGIKVDSVIQQDAYDVEKPLVKSFNFKLDMEQTGDYYFLDPFFLSSFRKNPFTDSLRRTDIDFGCNQYYSVGMYITMPGNMVASDIPANKEIRLADSSFSFGRFTAVQNNAVLVRNHFELNNASFSAEQYPFVKQVFEKMYALLNERIVFKKKE